MQYPVVNWNSQSKPIVSNFYTCVVYYYCPGLGSQGRVFLAPWSPSRSCLKKKTGAGAAWKNSKFLLLKKQLFYLKFFCRFTLLVCGEKNIFLEPFFLASWSRSRSWSKKIPGAGAAWEKNQEPELLEKIQELEPLKYLPGPQPCFLG